MRELARRLSTVLAKSDEGLARSCWLLYGLIPPCGVLLVWDVLQPLVTVLLILMMLFSYERLQHALGTLYASHFENVIFCNAAALSIFSGGQVIVPVLEGYAREFFLLVYMIPIIWGLHRLATGAFMLSRRRSFLGEADA
jgi:hypothetical protein